MKKVLSLVVCTLFVLGLAGCGVPQEKLDSLKAKHEEVKTKAGQLSDILAEMETVGQKLGMGGLFPASVSTGLSEMETALAERDDVIANDLNKMSEEEVDEALTTMDEELAMLDSWLPPLEDVNGSLANMFSLMSTFEGQMTQISDGLTAGNISTETQDALLALQDKALGMQEEMNTLSAEMNTLGDEDIQGAADALAKVEGMLQELSDDAQSILDNMGGQEAAA